MSTNSFSFPPPPPPPPQAAYAESTPFSNSFRGRGDKRWERGSRGRGRGTGHRGSRGGNHSYGPNPSPSVSGIQGHHGSNYPLPNYPPLQQPQYSADPRNPYGTSPPSYAPVASPPVQQQTYPYYSPPFHVAQPQAASYQYGPPNYTPHVPQYPYQLPPREHIQPPNNRYASPPVNLGPPMRMGFGAQETHPAPHDYFNPSDSRPPHRQRGGRGSHNRRSNSSGVGTSINSRGNESTMQPTNVSATHGTQVAPAVPSFGNPLPVKPPAPQIETKKAKKKKKRRVNQLGLTPKTVEHASSSEEDDIDEELKLAATVTAATTAPRLQFTYKGQMSTLQSPDEIASWLEERKKRFPTAARKAEKEARLRKSREEQEEKKRAERLLERQKRTLEKDRQAIQQDKQDTAAKAKLKVEKLRKRLEKEERRIAKSEAKSRKRSAAEADEEPLPEAKRLKREGSTGAGESAPIVAESAASHRMDDRSKGDLEADSSNPIQDPLTPTSQPAIPDSEVKSECKLDQPLSDSKVLQLSVTDCSAPQSNIKSEEPQNGTVDTVESADSPSASSNDTSEDEEEDDDTSSSGSSSSDSESDAEAPVSSRPQGPQRVKPPKRVDKQTKAVCRDFLQTGRCRRGRRCRWRHALPEREHRKAETETPFRVERKSLHQRLVEQELEKERQEKNKSDQHDNQTHHDTQIKVE
ncbi:hypothetical protein XPA_008428 [Xanthoria parietina]